MEIYARLDNATGSRVLCAAANKTCGGVLATVQTFMHIDGVKRCRKLDILPGWVFDEILQCYRLSNYACRQIARGKPAKFRRRLISYWPSDPPIVTPTERPSLWPRPLPFRAECPRCGHVNTLTTERLGITDVELLDIPDDLSTTQAL